MLVAPPLLHIVSLLISSPASTATAAEALATVEVAAVEVAASAHHGRDQNGDPASVGGHRSGEAAVEVAAAEVAPVFVKGELAHAGTIRLVPRTSFVGTRLGMLLQDTTLYLTVSPKLDLHLMRDRLHLGFEVPLNLEMYSLAAAADAGSGSGGFAHTGRVRARDWDEARDFVKILRYLTYGKKEDPLFLSVGQLHATTIGHGTNMRRYAANVDVDHTRVGLEVDAYGTYGGVEMAIADVTRGNLFGMLGFVKPLAAFSSDAMLRSLSVGVHAVTDQAAPLRLKRAEPVGSASLGVVQTDDTGSPLTDVAAATLFGADAELKVFRNDVIDLKTYADFSQLAGAGNGITAGALGRFNFRTDGGVHLLRARVEARTYSSNFVPGYFDTLYEYQKIQFNLSRNEGSADFDTKLGYVLNREGPRRVGVFVEASYALPDWFVVAAAIETDNTGEDRHLMLHAEVPFKYLDLFATYHQRNFERLFTLSDNDVIYAGGRMQLLPVLFLNGRLQKSFGWDPTAFDGLGGYGSQFAYQVDLELGVRL